MCDDTCNTQGCPCRATGDSGDMMRACPACDGRGVVGYPGYGPQPCYLGCVPDSIQEGSA